MSSNNKNLGLQAMESAIEALRLAFPLSHPKHPRTRWRNEYASSETQISDYYQWLAELLLASGQSIDKTVWTRLSHIQSMGRDLEGAFSPEHPDYTRSKHDHAGERPTSRPDTFPKDYWQGCFLALEEKGRTPQDFAAMLASYRLARDQARILDLAAARPKTAKKHEPRL